MSRRVLLTLAYDGTAYAGWQRQANAPTVQQTAEEALTGLLGRPVALTASSRTDAGVHARGQRAAFDASGCPIPLAKLPQVLNGRLPADIAVLKAEAVPDGFNPRFAARQKTYRYQIINAPVPDPLLIRYGAFVPQPLDAAAMGEAAGLIAGRRDFAAFKDMSPDDRTRPGRGTVREVFACGVARKEALVTLTVTGDGFLYHMVRVLAGTLLYVGLRKLSPSDIPGVLASRDRTRAGKTMPPQGLTLMDVAF